MNLKDLLFKLRLSRGTRIVPPNGLIDISYQYLEKLPDTFEIFGLISPYSLSRQKPYTNHQFFSGSPKSFIVHYHYSLIKKHPMHEWLLKCEGLWKITVDEKEKQVYINFARNMDAAMFRIMSA